MKIACIGDLHGTNRWKEALELSVDHYVFVGDYVDAPDLSKEQEIGNLMEVINFKATHPERVTLLLGNHDYQYLFYPDYRCSGFNPAMLPELKRIFETHLDHFQVAACLDSYLFVHAGLNRRWVQEHIGPFEDIEDLVRLINQMHVRPEFRKFLGLIGESRGGKSEYGGPLWCDFEKELIKDPLPGTNQVVGHTRSTFLKIHELAGHHLINVNYLAYSDNPIYVLDTLK